MQEAQYGSSGVRELMGRIARSQKPCLAIMNMPPLPYLKRIPGLPTEALEACYADPGVWKDFDPALTTLASPDPQAFRPPDQPKNVLHVGLPTNFKAARFDGSDATALLRNLEADIEAARFDPGDGAIEIPVKLKVHDSIFVPLAKWPMLMAGNYRCIRRDDMIPIKEAVHANVDQSREVYDWVWSLCASLGASDDDMVPFEKYAKAAEGLGKASSAARALFGGAAHIERVDCLVRGSPANRDSSPTRWTRSSRWWTSALQAIVQRNESDPRGGADTHSGCSLRQACTTAAAPARAHWPSCGLAPPQTPIAPTILPSMTIGTPPSTGTAPLSPSTRHPSPPVASMS